MAYAFVGQHAFATSSNTVTSLAPPAWTPGAGNHLYAILQTGAAATGISISDGVNTWISIGSFTDTTHSVLYTAYEANTVAAASTTVTGSVVTGHINGIYVREDSGLASPAYVVGSFTGAQVNAPGTGTNAIATGNINITNVPCALIGFCAANSSTAAPNAGSGFTSRTAVWSNNFEAAPEDQRVAGASNISVTYTAISAGGSNDYTVLGAVFTEVSSTGASTGAAQFASPGISGPC